MQLVDAREQFVKMRKSMGEKRKEISAEQTEGHRPHLLRLHRGRRRRRNHRREDLPQRVLRVPAHHRRTAPPAPAGPSPAPPPPNSLLPEAWSLNSTPRNRSDLIETLDTLAGTDGASEKALLDKIGPVPKTIAKDLAKVIAISRSRGPTPDQEGPASSRPFASGPGERPPARRQTGVGQDGPRRHPAARRRRPRGPPWTPTWKAKCFPGCRMPGSITRRPRSATRYRSPGTSTATRHPGPSHEIDAEIKVPRSPRSKDCLPR